MKVFKFLSRCFKLLITLVVTLGLLGAEPLYHSIVTPRTFLSKNPKLLQDTRALVALTRKEKILRSLNKVALKLSPEEKWQLVELIDKESHAQFVDPQLVIAMIKIESEFRNEALSRANARGLMQVRYHTAREIARETGLEFKRSKSLHDPKLNIKMGTYYLRKMLKRFDNVDLALTAYNIGPTALRKIMISKDKVPRKYCNRVLKVYAQIKPGRWETM